MARGIQELNDKTVTALIGRIAQAWNRQDLEGVCAAYAHDAVYITNAGCVRGRENILADYQSRYPDGSAMGSLSLKLTDFLSVRTGVQTEPCMASAVLTWQLTLPNEQVHAGWSLIVVKATPSGILITHDASI